MKLRRKPPGERTEEMAISQTEIKATAIYKVTSKVDGSTCWYVPADSQDEPYKVCFGGNLWSCTCKHGEYAAKRGIDCRCKHHRAVQVSILANRTHHEEQEQLMAEFSAEMKAAARPPRGSLNGGGKAFSLLK
jgi:hypothetical protein